MKITTEDRKMLGELYYHLLWFTNFAKKLPTDEARFDADNAAGDVLYAMGYADGWLECAGKLSLPTS